MGRTLLVDKERVRRNFDRHAGQYDQYAIVQRWMAERLLGYVAEWAKGRQVRRVLEIGCGTGMVTAGLVQLFPQAHITALDLSDRMIEETRKRLGGEASDVSFIVADAEMWSWACAQMMQDHNAHHSQEFTYDVIVSSAVFQWFNDPQCTCQSLLQLVRSNGLCAFATFAGDTFHELHQSFAAAELKLGLPMRPHGQSYPYEADWREIFEHQGSFQWQQQQYMLTYPDVLAFMHSVKRVGASNAVMQADQAGSSRALLQAMSAHYEQHFAANSGEGIQVTYDVGYGIYCREG
ncbi:malonyl-ACP O-methyltransferase BioC [Paenibacillus guangzhouensis]|uniref:malonyl-ACP O-methyltransferase BioC n=1 Tax=Paenibacillus guangzhouensis TaxID=1473112 RepID=UPI00126778D0|nr:malonyl-ACP O-methyltransferase BioC [Paenibacillus guangzhouensis]